MIEKSGIEFYKEYLEKGTNYLKIKEELGVDCSLDEFLDALRKSHLINFPNKKEMTKQLDYLVKEMNDYEKSEGEPFWVVDEDYYDYYEDDRFTIVDADGDTAYGSKDIYECFRYMLYFGSGLRYPSCAAKNHFYNIVEMEDELKELKRILRHFEEMSYERSGYLSTFADEGLYYHIDDITTGYLMNLFPDKAVANEDEIIKRVFESMK